MRPPLRAKFFLFSSSVLNNENIGRPNLSIRQISKIFPCSPIHKFFLSLSLSFSRDSSGIRFHWNSDRTCLLARSFRHGNGTAPSRVFSRKKNVKKIYPKRIKDLILWFPQGLLLIFFKFLIDQI